MMRNGFTLVELAIVLVIIGLLIGGVLQGQELINQAQIRSIMKEFNSIQTSINTFRAKYNALPGDMKNAVKFWGAAAGGTANGLDSTCRAVLTAATGTETCNGNGDGMIAGQFPQSDYYYEGFRAWQHLENAQLVKGHYTGVTNGATMLLPSPVPGSNVMASGFSTAGWSFRHVGVFGNFSTWFTTNYGTMLYFGAPPASGVTGWTDLAAMRPEMAYGIDEKMDDGKPGTGNILTYKYHAVANPYCVNTSNTDYDLSKETVDCSLMFKTGF